MTHSSRDILRMPLPLIFTLYGALIVLFVWHGSAVDPQPLIDSPVARALDSLCLHSALIATTLSVAITLLNSIIISRLINRYWVAVTKSYLMALLYIIFFGALCFPTGSFVEPLVAMLMLLSSKNMVLGYHEDKPVATQQDSYSITMLRRQSDKQAQSSAVFTSLFLITTAALIYPPAIVLVAMSFVVMMIYGHLLREFYLGLLGIVVSVVLFSWIFWICGNAPLYLVESFWQSLTAKGDGGFVAFIVGRGLGGWIFAAYTVVSVVVALIFLSRHKMRPRPRRIHIHFFVMLLATLGALFIPSSDQTLIAFFAAECTLLVYSLMAQTNRHAAATVGFVLFVLAAVVANFL